MDVIRPLLYGVGLPAVVCAAGLTLAFVFSRRRHATGPSGATASAHTLAYVLAFAALFGWPELPPVEHWRWLPFVAVVGCIVGVIDVHGGPARWWVWVIRVAGAALLAVLITPDWADSPVAMMMLAFAGLLIHWALLRVLIERAGPRVSPAVLLIAFFGMGYVLVSSGNTKLAQSSVAMTAACIGQVLVLLPLAKRIGEASFFAVMSALLVAHATLGNLYNYSDIEGWLFAVAAAVPFAAFVADIGAMGRWSGWRVGAVRIICCVLLAGGVVAWATIRANA